MKRLWHSILVTALATAPWIAQADFGFGIPGFASNSAALDERSRAILLDAAVILKRMPDHRLKLYGSRGQLETDPHVSQRRLENARRFLVSAGVSADRILVEDRGSDAPLQPSCQKSERPDDCDRYNRNIQLQLVAP